MFVFKKSFECCHCLQSKIINYVLLISRLDLDKASPPYGRKILYIAGYLCSWRISHGMWISLKVNPSKLPQGLFEAECSPGIVWLRCFVDTISITKVEEMKIVAKLIYEL